MKDVYQILIENLTNERLDEIAFQDKNFCSADERLDGALKEYGELSLPEKEAKVVDRVFEMYALQCARYARAAYSQGMEDAVQLLKKMGVIGK